MPPSPSGVLISRRTVLVNGASLIGVAGAPSMALGKGAFIPAPYLAPKYIAPSAAPSKIVIASRNEPGERMVVNGRVTDGDGALAGVSLYVFHADAGGFYTRDGSNSDENARLFGALRTDANGRFRYESIRPVGYSNNGAHIHYVVAKSGHRLRMEEVRFQDDPKALNGLAGSQRQASPASPDYIFAVLPAVRDTAGVWHVTHHIPLERA